jgi:hypothetical protein
MYALAWPSLVSKVVFREYKKEFTSSVAAEVTDLHLPVTIERSSFFTELVMLDDGDDRYLQEQEKSEYERYFKLGQGSFVRATLLF